MAIPELIYCGGGNPRFYEIATQAGFLYGAQLPDTVYGPLHFADQDWKNPDRERYMVELAKYQPYMASVLDWETREQLPEVLAWAEDAAQFVQVVMIIPKVMGGIGELPRVIGGRPVRLGYSVPTKFGGTSLPAWEFFGRPVHLLGGSPHKQRWLIHYFNVVSVDGSMISQMATRYCAFWHPNSRRYAKGHWPSLYMADGRRWGDDSGKTDAPYEAFRRSCKNIWSMWHQEAA